MTVSKRSCHQPLASAQSYRPSEPCGHSIDIADCLSVCLSVCLSGRQTADADRSVVQRHADHEHQAFPHDHTTARAHASSPCPGHCSKRPIPGSLPPALRRTYCTSAPAGRKHTPVAPPPLHYRTFYEFGPPHTTLKSARCSIMSPMSRITTVAPIGRAPPLTALCAV